MALRKWQQIAFASLLISSLFSLGAAVTAQDDTDGAATTEPAAEVTADASTNNPVSVADVEFVEWVTGPESPNQTQTDFDVDGTDLGSMFELDGTVYVAMGDTFGCCRPEPDGGGGGSNWRNNVVAYSTDRDLSDGMTLDGWLVNRRGRARELLYRAPGEFTRIPTYGIAIGERMYLHYMGVQVWGEPGHWTLMRSGWAYSDDRGETWVQPTDATWEGDTNFGQAALVKDDEYLYIFGIHGGRYGGVALARVPLESVLDMSAYTYWSGDDWLPELEAATEIIPAPVGELSVAWNEFANRWIMLYLHEPKHGIVMRSAPELTGPWSDDTMVVSSDEFPALYGSYLHPWASSGEEIYFNMSQWVPYNIRLMRARLVLNE
jgi:hypothetical protein